MPALSPILNLAPAPLPRQPRQTRLQRPPPRMVINQRRIDAARVADLERLQVGLERVPEQDWGGGRGEDGEDVGLDGVEGGGGGRERVGGDAGPAREVVGDGLGGLDERVVDDDAGGVVDEADAGELLAAFCETLSHVVR